MKKTVWTQWRLERLFRRYNAQYWDGKLSAYNVGVGNLSKHGAVGLCDWREGRITVDVAAHDDDRDIRATLLHEMAHAADRSQSRYSHGDGFFAQIEHLLQKGAPITVKMPEMPGHVFPLAAVPEKYPLCRRAAARLEKRRALEMAMEKGT